MRIPKTVLIMGSAHLLSYRTQLPYPANSMPLERSFRNYLIATNAAKNTLYLFPNATTGKKKILTDSRDAQRGFVHTAMQYEIPTMELKQIGIVESIQYSSDWWEAHFEKYEHVFAKHPILYADRKARFTILAIKHQLGTIVTPQGIE